MTPQAIVFDIGRVLINWNPEQFYDRKIGETRRKQLFAAVDLYRMNESVDLGRPLAEATADLAAQHPDYATEIAYWHTHWLQMVGSDIPETARLLRGLRAAGLPVFALSNFGKDTFATAETAFPVLQEFDQKFVSGHLGVIKPDPRIYEILEQDTGVAPKGLFFIDDRVENIAAAQARGWQGHVFETPQGLAAELRRLGLPATL